MISVTQLAGAAAILNVRPASSLIIPFGACTCALFIMVSVAESPDPPELPPDDLR